MKWASSKLLAANAWNLVVFSAVFAVPGLLISLAHIFGFAFNGWQFELGVVLLLTGISHTIATYTTTVSLSEIALRGAKSPEGLFLISGALIAGTTLFLLFMWRFLITLFPTTLLAILAAFFWVMSNAKRYASSKIPRDISTVVYAGLVLILLESLLLMNIASLWSRI